MATSSKLVHQELNLFTLPLTGRILLEASAGTGKTYSLAFIYLRLLLGIGCKQTYTTDQILVVTFTKAATEELRFRIRQNIQQLRLACVKGDEQQSDLQQLVDLIEDKQKAIVLLTHAEQSMDEAAIFTIHGFCQRILSTFAFETGTLFQQNLVKDESQLLIKVVRDFWRNYFNPLPKSLAKVIRGHWDSPEVLLSEIRPYLSRVIPQNSPPKKNNLTEKLIEFHDQKTKLISGLKQFWMQTVDEISVIISQSDVNKRSYSKANLPKWLKKVSDWSNQTTEDYFIPNELSKFSQKELDNKTPEDKIVPEHSIFTQIDQVLEANFDLKKEILFDLVTILKQQIHDQKLALAQMGFDDLLLQLHEALNTIQGESLANFIAEKFPIAMIDEFQDTDPIQYQIFDKIYQNRELTYLLFIGDPKQAIYSFRGADIFTYIQAKKSVDQIFTMRTNWRSSANMVNAVNELFQKVDNPFIFEAIPFIKMNYAPKNSEKTIQINQSISSPLTCYLLPEEITSKEEYQRYSAEYCAEQITGWLSGDCKIIDNGMQRIVKSSDIAILVRTQGEAEVIQQVLNARNIKSVYASNHKSVFESSEATEVLRILQAILNPTNETALRVALTTQLIGATMQQIANLNDNQVEFETLIEEFKDYQTQWFKYGVLVMLRHLMRKRNLTANLLILKDGERIITNFMHLGELLQESSQTQDSPHALVRWLARQISHTDLNMENHEQRLESDENLINIITIHKSKGLEYNIVCLPFVGSYRKSTSQVYYDRKSFQPHFAFDMTEEVQDWIEQERLAEDLRLFYVAITRSIYFCLIGLAGLKKGNTKNLDLVNSSLGYLLLQNTEGNYDDLIKQLSILNYNHLSLVELPIKQTKMVNQPTDQNKIIANQFCRKLDFSWRVTSYTGLQQSTKTNYSNQYLFEDIIPSFDIETISDIGIGQLVNTTQNASFSIHNFPKGAIVGTLLHECLENMDFYNPDTLSAATYLIQQLNIDEQWIIPISEWFKRILQVQLIKPNLTLAHIKDSTRLNELEFYLPLRKTITANQLNALCKKYDPHSYKCDELTFDDVKGMLKGFIDMVFIYEDKYYIVDYKSNYLGDDSQAYNQHALSTAICDHRYDLQYQLYSLALHRYLKNRLSNYDYNIHFGGVFYLFLRGMDLNTTQNGIFYTKLEYNFIQELDKLFSD
ncbi:exodeoxyribonuclease V subunit beta [Orbaceae bacterium ac157xtp]